MSLITLATLVPVAPNATISSTIFSIFSPLMVVVSAMVAKNFEDCSAPIPNAFETIVAVPKNLL